MDIVIAYCDDWEALYINGKLCEEDHTLCIGHVFDHVLDHGGKVNSFKFVQIAPNEYGDIEIPQLLKDLKVEE